LLITLLVISKRLQFRPTPKIFHGVILNREFFALVDLGALSLQK